MKWLSVVFVFEPDLKTKTKMTCFQRFFARWKIITHFQLAPPPLLTRFLRLIALTFAYVHSARFNGSVIAPRFPSFEDTPIGNKIQTSQLSAWRPQVLIGPLVYEVLASQQVSISQFHKSRMHGCSPNRVAGRDPEVLFPHPNHHPRPPQLTPAQVLNINWVNIIIIIVGWALNLSSWWDLPSRQKQVRIKVHIQQVVQPSPV